MYESAAQERPLFINHANLSTVYVIFTDGTPCDVDATGYTTNIATKRRPPVRAELTICVKVGLIPIRAKGPAHL